MDVEHNRSRSLLMKCFLFSCLEDVLATGSQRLHKLLKTCCEAEGKVMKRSGKPAKKTQ